MSGIVAVMEERVMYVEDPHWAGRGRVEIDADALDEYQRLVGP